MEFYLKNGILGLAVLAIIGVPLIVSTGTLFPFMTGKQMFFQAVVSLMGIFYAGLLWKNPSRWRPRSGPVLTAVLVFLGALGLSTLLSIDPSWSFWSTIERMDGLVHYLYWGIFFLILTSTLKTSEDRHWLIKGFVVSGLAVSLYIILQEFNLLGLRPNPEARVYGSLGNATFLATILLFQPFMATLLWLKEKRPVWRLIAGLDFTGALVLVILSGTRGAFLGLGMAGLLLWGILVGFIWQRGRRFLAGSLIILAIVAGGGLVFLYTSGGIFALEPLPSLLHIEPAQLGQLPSSLGNRLISSKISLSAWQDKPILGWGLAAHRYAFGFHFDPQMLSNTDSWHDKAHNLPLEFLADTGLVGFLSYLSLFLACFWIFWQARKKQVAMVLLLGGLLAAYFVNNLFLFDTPSSLVYFAVVLALVEQLGKVRPSRRLVLWQKTLWRNGAVLLALVLAGSFPFTTVRPLQAATLGGRAAEAQSQGQIALATEHYQRAFSLGTYVDDKLLRQGELLIFALARNRPIEPTNKLVSLFLQEHQEFLQKHPLFYMRWVGLAHIYIAVGRYNPPFLSEAQKVLELAKKLHPDRPEAYLSLTDVYKLQGNLGRAEQEVDQLIAKDPAYGRALWEKARLLAWQGQEEPALKLIKGLLVSKLNWQELLIVDGISYSGWQELLAVLQDSPLYDPEEDISYNLALSIIHQRLGNIEEAKAFAQKGASLYKVLSRLQINKINQIGQLKPVEKEK